MSRSLFFLPLLLAAAPILHAADQPNPAEARMRETLRATMIQLRTAETERAALQAAQVENEQKRKELSESLAVATKHSVDDKEAADKSINVLSARLAGAEADRAQLKEALEKSQANLKKATELAGLKEAERAKLAGRVIVLDRIVADQRTKNLALFKTGSEILTRYEKFGLGEALAAREPFTGITRVKLQNLVQDYGDKLVDQRIK